MSITIDTVGACLAHGYKVHGACPCGHSAEIDLLAVAAAKGESYTLERLWNAARCSKCRSRRVSMQIVPDWNPYPGAPARRSA